MTSVLMVLSLLASFFFIYQIWLLGPVERMIRYCLIALFLIIDFTIFSKNYKLVSAKRKKKNTRLFTTLMVLFILVNVVAGTLVNKVYSSLDSINKKNITYTSQLVTLSKNQIRDPKEIKKAKIGMLVQEDSVEGNVIAREMIQDFDLEKDNTIQTYEDVSEMIRDLYQNQVDYIFVSSNYVMMFEGIEEYQNIRSETKVLASKEKSVKKKETKSEFVYSNGKELTEPFTVLLMGVDSEKDGLDKNAVAHGDSLILITFNPETLNATMLTVTRDSYVPIQCFDDKRENKITHAAWYGTNCMTETIEKFLDIKIDYYFKINFKGAVQLVNDLGGIEAEVPYDLCTDSSDRTGEVCIKKGWQTLDGEGALVLARNRYDLPNGDLDRGQNQQKVLQAIINKLKTVNSIPKVTEILDDISHNLDTNMSTNQILSLYNIGKDILERSGSQGDDMFTIEHLYLQGEGQKIYDPKLKLTLWNYIPNRQSVKDISLEMKRNLGIEEPEMSKEFHFSIDENYQAPVIGKGPYKNTTLYDLLPNFVGEKKSDIEDWAKRHNVQISFKEVTDHSSSYANGTAIQQNYMARSRLDQIGKIEVTIIKKSGGNQSNDCSDQENKNSICYLPSFIGKNKEEVNTWNRQLKKQISITYNEVSKAAYPNTKIGTVVAQNYKVKTHLSKVGKLELTIVVK